MKTIKLSGHELTQLYVLLSMFSQLGELKKQDFSPAGPARKLAGKIVDFLQDYDGPLILEKACDADR